MASLPNPPKARPRRVHLPRPHPQKSPPQRTASTPSKSPSHIPSSPPPPPSASSSTTAPQIHKLIKTHNLPISKTLKLSKLKSDFKSREAKRQLMSSYDAFLADKRIIELLPRLLGKQFYKKKRMVPVPVDLQKRNWKEQVDRVVGSAMVHLGSGTCSVVRVGRVSMSCEEIVDNVVAAVDGIVEEVVPRKWGGVRSFHLKLLESLALPVYQAVPDETLLRMEGGKEGVGDEKKVQLVR